MFFLAVVLFFFCVFLYPVFSVRTSAIAGFGQIQHQTRGRYIVVNIGKFAVSAIVLMNYKDINRVLWPSYTTKTLLINFMNTYTVRY